MIFNDCWNEFNDNIQSKTNRDFEFKLRAINLGNNYLASRFVQLVTPESLPGELKAGATNLTNDATSNKFSIPSNFLSLLNAWYKDSTDYLLFSENQQYDYQTYLRTLGSDFFDTTYTGTPGFFSISEPYLYTDTYFTASGTDNIKIDYIKVPDTIYGYSQINVTSVPASFSVGETITGSSTSAVGIIYSKGTGYIRCLINDVSGEFTSADTLTCTNSVDIATVTSFVSGSETLMLGLKYKSLLIEAWALQWNVMKGTDEIEARSETVDTMIQDLAMVNRVRTSNWGY